MSAVRLGATIPALPVRDAATAAAAYRGRFGFAVRHLDAGFAVVARDAAELHLWQAGDASWAAREDLLRRPVCSGAESFLAGTASCRVEVDEVDALWAELERAGVLHPVARSGPADTDFGTREFAALDLDGNLLTFFARRSAGQGRGVRVLVTGAAGGVARLLLPGLAGRAELRLTDRVAPPAVGDAEVAVGELADERFLREVTAGVDAVVHLAGDPRPTATWEELEEPNLRVPALLLRALAGHGVRRVVLASSGHAAGAHLHAGRTPVDEDWPPAPCCAYGATKAFLEAAARVHQFRHGGSVVCLRLGYVAERPPGEETLGGWLAPGDLRSLVLAALRAADGFAVVHGVSANTRSPWSARAGRELLGWTPECDSEAYASGPPAGLSGALCPPDAPGPA